MGPIREPSWFHTLVLPKTFSIWGQKWVGQIGQLSSWFWYGNSCPGACSREATNWERSWFNIPRYRPFGFPGWFHEGIQKNRVEETNLHGVMGVAVMDEFETIDQSQPIIIPVFLWATHFLCEDRTCTTEVMGEKGLGAWAVRLWRSLYVCYVMFNVNPGLINP